MSSSGALLVAGTTSDAGKSMLTAALCRWLARQGVHVAPFKAQNMSLNSVVTADGAEIGRAQAAQAAAAGVEPEAAMNPVLLKPGSDRHSQLIVLGRPVAEVDAVGYRAHKPRLLGVALQSLADLRSRFDVVVCEGAGSPTEINLRDTDIANMGLARAARLPVVVVGDIDRGGVFAALFGTLALLSRADQALVAGFVINKMRGDDRLLAPGLAMLQRLTGRPVLGTLPWTPGLRLDAEDSLALDQAPGEATAPCGEQTLRVAVVRLPRISNFTDVDPLLAEPGVDVRWTRAPGPVADADLVVVPGTRATVDDLDWLRRRGLAEALRRRAADQRPVLGVCGGYQILGASIEDDVESRRGSVPGLGLLPVRTRFAGTKTLGRPRGRCLRHGMAVAGYEIHHGVVERHGGDPLLAVDGPTDGTGQVEAVPAAGPEQAVPAAGPAQAGRTEGCRVGSVWGLTWHGVLENDAYRRAFLADVAAVAGRRFRAAADTRYAALREARLDLLADLVPRHLDTGAVWRLIERGSPPGLPFVPPGPPC